MMLKDELRGNIRLNQYLGSLKRPHTLTVEYSFRDRLFNGSLGFQTVQSTVGAVLTSPVIPIGETGISLSYQGGIQNINANTDRQELLSADRSNNRVNLTRYQGAASLRKSFLSGKVKLCLLMQRKDYVILLLLYFHF